MASGIKILEEREGGGATAEKGDTVSFECAGYLSRGDCIHERRLETATLGQREIIAGIERSLIGMREGGYRKVRISPHLAYGKSGVTDRIPPNAVLTYDLTLVSVQKDS
jgi:FKBP-type peptidyl-prolyl cis-trans isomerase